MLASKIMETNTISIEALPQTFRKMKRNLAANDIVDSVIAHRGSCALGEKQGEITFTTDLDTMNHVATDSDSDVCSVPDQQTKVITQRP